MNKFNLLNLIFLMSISGCLSQPSAPIEYNNSKAVSHKNSEPRIKYNNLTKESLPEEEHIHSVVIKPQGNLKTVIFEEDDNLINIANKYGVSVNAILIANNLNNESEVLLGRKLVIPEIKVYYVKESENFDIIAEEFNQDKLLFARLNNLKAPYEVKAGDRLDIMIKPDLKNQVNAPVARNIEAKENPNIGKEVTLIPKQSSFVMPVDGLIKSRFGEADGVRKEGVIITAAMKTPVKATADGLVLNVVNKPDTFGKFLIIKHKDNSLSAYAHLDDIIVTKGAEIKAGDLVGHVGKTGQATEPELYFALKIDGKPVNPVLYFNK